MLQLFQIGWSHMASGGEVTLAKPEWREPPVRHQKDISGAGKKNTCKALRQEQLSGFLEL